MMESTHFVSFENAAEFWRRAGVKLSKIVKVNTSIGWSSNPQYIPVAGQIAVCIDRYIIDGKKIPGIKIGDGLAYYTDLPFIGEEEINQLAKQVTDHINNKAIHVSSEDRAKWDSKIDCILDGETLYLTRN